MGMKDSINERTIEEQIRQALYGEKLFDALASTLGGTLVYFNQQGTSSHVLFDNQSFLQKLHLKKNDSMALHDLPGMPAELIGLIQDGYHFSNFVIHPRKEELPASYRLSCRPVIDVSTRRNRGFLVLLRDKIAIDPPGTLRCFTDIEGTDAAFLRAKARAILMANTSRRILLTGECGTGKDLFAEAIHSSSECPGRFIKVSGPSVTISHAAKFFLGFQANGKHYPGVLEQANGGTLYLDSIDEIASEVQPMIMQILDTSEVVPIGSSTPVKLSFRLISSSTKDISQKLRTGEFRGDLYYRMAHETITLPPLRDRIVDILPLARRAVDEYCQAQGIPAITISSEASRAIMNFSWRGNVRELNSAMKQACRSCSGGIIKPEDFPRKIIEGETTIEIARIANREKPIEKSNVDSLEAANKKCSAPHTILPLKDDERERITFVYEATGNDAAKTAQILNMSSTTLYRRLKQYGLK